MAVRWIRPEPGCVFELTAVWSGMAQPVVFRVEQYRIMGNGSLEVLSGISTPYVALLPSDPPALLIHREVYCGTTVSEAVTPEPAFPESGIEPWEVP